MSANLGRRLYAHIWDTANPFLGRIRINRVSASDAYASRSFLDSSLSSHTRRISTLPTKPTRFKRFASGGFLVLGVSPTSTAADNTAACIISSPKIAAQHVWKRTLHTSNDRLRGKAASQDTHERNENDHPQKPGQSGKDTSTAHSQVSPPKDTQQPTTTNRHLMDRLPHMPQLHRPTKEELLAAATGFWSRLKVRFKWFSIRSVRPYNMDEITALFSWVLLGHIVWVVVGTTTFFSLLILAINTVFAQGTSIRFMPQ